MFGKNLKNKRNKSWQQWLLLLLKVMLIFALGWGIKTCNISDFLNVKISWEIDPALPISKTMLSDKIQPLIQNKYKLNLNKIKSVLEQYAWVERATVRRLFWNSILITVSAEKIALRWRTSQKCDHKKQQCRGYISSKGKLFIPQIITASNAVQVATKNKNPKSILKIHQDYQQYQSLLAPLKIKSIVRSNIDTLIIEPDIRLILGHQHQVERLLNFKRIYPLQKSKTKRSMTFDMRYPKGFSLQYR